jgi:hypothetical protein
MLYVARRRFEEMAEEFQDGVKQVASAYGALINNANEAGKGRYSIFDDGYFKDAAERYLTSWSSWGYRWTYGYDWAKLI